MDLQASFAKLWNERFPGEIAPIVFPHATEALNNNFDKGQISGTQGSETDAFRRDAIETLLACEKQIELLEKQLTKEKFIKDYLMNFLESNSRTLPNGFSEIDHVTGRPGVNFPDPGEVKVGEVCTRVIRGRKSRVTSTSSLDENVYDNSPFRRNVHTHKWSKQIVRTPHNSQTTTTTANNGNHSSGGVTINKISVFKSDSVPVDYVCGESVAQRAKLITQLSQQSRAVHFEEENSLSDKSTLTDPPAAVYNIVSHNQPPIKTKPKPVPLPRPKRGKTREEPVDQAGEVLSAPSSENQHQVPSNGLEPTSSGRADFNSLLSAENNTQFVGPVEQASCVSQCANVKVGHDSPDLNTGSGKQTETRQANRCVASEPSQITSSSVYNLSKCSSDNKAKTNVKDSCDKNVFISTDNKPTDQSVSCKSVCFKPTSPGNSVLQLARRASLGRQVNVTEEPNNTSDSDTVTDPPYDRMMRKLTQRPSDSDGMSVTGLKYRPRNDYNTVEFTGTGSPRISTGSESELIVGSPKKPEKLEKPVEPHYENSCIHHGPLPPLPNVVSGIRVSSSGVSTDTSGISEPEDNDPKGEFEESLYETLAVGKSFHAALTAEDESFDSLSLNSDNDTARSDASVDSGVGSKVSLEQPSSPDLQSGLDIKDPYSMLYATVSKLKRESSNEATSAPVLKVTDSEPVAELTVPPRETNVRERRSRVPDYEYVNIGPFENAENEPMTTSPSVPEVPVPEVPVRKVEPRPVRHIHAYEECFPPGLSDSEPAATSSMSNGGIQSQSHEPNPDVTKVNASPPVVLRRDHTDSRPNHNRNSQETGSTNRNSSPLSHVLDLDSSDDSDGGNRRLSSPNKEKLRLRELVLRGILETEKNYQASLEVLLQYMKSLEAAAVSSQPVISIEDIKVIFSKIPELHSIHMRFVHDLAQRLDSWTPQQTVGDLFEVLVSSFPVYSEYMKNYPKAVETITRCSEEKQVFRELANQIAVPKSKDTLSLQNMLFKPVVRIQRNTLVLHDLMNCTPKGHIDYEELDKARRLSTVNLEEYGDSTQEKSNRKIEEQQHLVKNSFLVEMMGGQRKLRHVFLFNDVIVCTKQKISGRTQRYNFEVKWYAPLTDIILTDHRLDQQVTGGDNNRESRISNMDEVEDLKKKVIALKTELKAEIKREKENENKEKSWSFASRSAVKAIEKQKRKLHELEAALVQASPSLPFKMYHKASGKSYMFLMSTDYEREEWSEAIHVNQTKFKSDLVNKPITAYDIQMLIENVKQLPKVNRVGNVLLRSSDDDGLNGILSVTIHRLSGLGQPSDTFCCLESDSYGHFFMTARTNVCRGEQNPVWDEEFEIDLDGAQTLRILCYRRGNESEGDVLLGKCALELKTCWLQESFQEKEISLNEYSLMVSIRYVTAATTMKRLPSRLKTGVFGVKITTLVKREGRKIPTIVTACVDEIERRGMDETGIYRVSGVTSDVQRLKKAFDKNSRAAVNVLSEFDIHAVSGVLKLYFRELPEPLFTEALYCNFIDSLELTDAKEKCMLSLLHSLPDPSLRTVLYLMDHLIRVSKHQKENRMNLNNVATIFGPTLLRPAAKDAGAPTPEMLFLGAQEAISQTAVLHYFITLREQGKDLNKPVSKA